MELTPIQERPEGLLLARSVGRDGPWHITQLVHSETGELYVKRHRRTRRGTFIDYEVQWFRTNN